MVVKRKEELIPACGYVRMSDDKQDASPQQQEDEIKAYAAREGYRIVKWYRDLGISGDDTENRQAFLRMRDDAKYSEWVAVICWNQSRFGRFDQLDAGYWIYPFRKAGAFLVTCDAGRVDWDSPEGQLIYGVNQMGKHKELRDRSKDVLRGLINKCFRAGRRTGGIAPFGYRLVLNTTDPEHPYHELAVDPITAPILRELFQRYASGKWTLRMLATDLTKRKIKTAAGRTVWHVETVRRILSNPVYIGVLRWNFDTAQSSYATVRNEQIVEFPKGKKPAHAASDVMEREGKHPPLVSKLLFQRVQERLLINKKRTTPKRGGSFVLTSLVKCGRCKRPMIGQNYGRQASRYRCIGQAEPCLHHIRSILCSDLEDYCVKDFADKFYDTEGGNGVHSVLMEAWLRKAIGNANHEAPVLRKRLAQIEREIDQAARRYATAPDSVLPELQRIIEEHKRERDQVAERLREVEELAIDDSEISRLAESINEAIREMQKALADPSTRATVLQRVVQEVRVFFADDFDRSKDRIERIEVDYRRSAFSIRALVSDLTPSGKQR